MGMGKHKSGGLDEYVKIVGSSSQTTTKIANKKIVQGTKLDLSLGICPCKSDLCISMFMLETHL